MSNGYRSWSERRDIIRSIIAETNPPELSTFALNESEETYFRARADKAISKLAKQTSHFKSYYQLPTDQPFGFVVGMASMTALGAIFIGSYIWLSSTDATRPFPLLAACVTVAAGAIGWAVAGWISHRNTVRQNTNNLLFARFSHTAFGEALHRFHAEFGTAAIPRINMAALETLRNGDCEENQKAAASVLYLLNYYEFIACGVIRGDFDKKIIESNIRGLVIYYYDKCEPLIVEVNKKNPLAFEHLRKLRTHYRNP